MLKTRDGLFLVSGALLAWCGLQARAGSEPAARQEATVEEMLRDFVEDFRSDPFASTPVTFGVRVKDADPSEWHVYVGGREEGAREAVVELAEGPPFEPAAFYVTDVETLGAIHQGRLAALTAMGKAFSTDFAPLDMDYAEGFRPTPEAQGHLTRLSFHFWTRGYPEVIPFGDGVQARPLHGGDGILFYYQPGFRSGWFRIRPGQHVNEEEAMQTNPFPSLLIGTRGRVHCRIGGRELDLLPNHAVLVGPDVAHEFWVDEGEEPAEGILVMFGEGA